MIALHGNPGTSNTIRQISGFEQVADDVAFLVAFPEATTDWNEGCGCSAAEAAGVDDVQFVRDLIDAVHAEVGVDRTSVFAAGFSQGGLFAEHLACRMTDALAGVAVVAATMSMPLASACEPSRSVPILILHGDLDSVFPESGTDDGDFLGVAHPVGRRPLGSSQWVRGRARDPDHRPSRGRFDDAVHRVAPGLCRRVGGCLLSCTERRTHMAGLACHVHIGAPRARKSLPRRRLSFSS